MDRSRIYNTSKFCYSSWGMAVVRLLEDLFQITWLKRKSDRTLMHFCLVLLQVIRSLKLNKNLRIVLMRLASTILCVLVVIWWFLQIVSSNKVTVNGPAHIKGVKVIVQWIGWLATLLLWLNTLKYTKLQWSE